MKDTHGTYGRFDLFTILLILLIGVVLLLVNLGLLPSVWMSYWPVILIAFALKAMLHMK